MAMRSMIESSDHDGELEKELGALLREQRGHEACDREEELSLYRSGSAPPTVQGSLNAVGGLFGEAVPALRFQNGGGGENGFVTDEELRSDPAYISYYYSNVNLNPRLPPPLLSREEVRFAQRFHGRGSGSVVGEIGDRGKTNMTGDGGGGTGSSSFFSMQKQDNVVESGKSAEWGGDGLIGLPGLGLGGRKKSIAEIIQDDLNHAKLASKHPSRPASRNAFDEEVETSDRQFALLHHELASMDSLQSASSLQNFGSSAAHSYASAVGSSLSRSTTPDPKLAARATSPCAQLVVGDRSSSLNKRATNISNSFGAVSPGFSEPADVVAAMSRMSLLTNDKVEEGPKNQHDINNGPNLFDLPTDPNHIKRGFDFNIAGSGNSVHSFSQPVNSSFLKGPSPVPAVSNVGSLPSLYQNMNVTNSSFPNYAYSVSPSSPSMAENQLGIRNLPPLYENAAASAIAVSGMDPRAFGGNFGGGPNIMAAAPEANHPSGNTLQIPFVDPLYLQYLRSTEYAAAQAGAITEPTVDREYMASLYMDLVQKALYGASPSSHKSQFGAPYVGKSASLSHNYYGNPAFGMGPILPNSPIGSSSPIRHGERNLRFSSGSRNLSGPLMGPWGPEAGGGFDESFASSLLNEFKSNKTRCFELFEISGHVVEFSADQYGSRFIQQKLETATADEREMVFHEIMPHALSLMTDVFGNYVVQKFFEHGTPSQIRELADQLTGHVLTSSLQMYGCRVIQKAIEVVELDQQIKMVAELDGHVMRCVRDQNGNHVIQKCIECVPEDSILFIISTFYDQIVSLSTHPYGCRVVQRILEHCRNPKTLGVVMKEILDSVCRLAQDQYGNYVIQHVLEHGKPEERSAIIKKLTGQIVQMSQQKFASNVVEKCLSYGNPVERQVLVNEMLGCSAENEPLQAMMKDQFANYVVQKVLETCDDQQLQQILNRIKVHLNALKKYTYGKHIVARVEKLVAAGEKRISVMCPNSTA